MTNPSEFERSTSEPAESGDDYIFFGLTPNAENPIQAETFHRLNSEIATIEVNLRLSRLRFDSEYLISPGMDGEPDISLGRYPDPSGRTIITVNFSRGGESISILARNDADTKAQPRQVAASKTLLYDPPRPIREDDPQHNPSLTEEEFAAVAQAVKDRAAANGFIKQASVPFFGLAA